MRNLLIVLILQTTIHLHATNLIKWTILELNG